MNDRIEIIFNGNNDDNINERKNLIFVNGIDVTDKFKKKELVFDEMTEEENIADLCRIKDQSGNVIYNGKQNIELSHDYERFKY